VRGGGGVGRGRVVCFDGRDGLLDVGLHLGAGEAGLAHDAADAGVIEDGDDELLQLDLDGEHGLLLRVDGPPALVRLRALEGGDERVGERRRVVDVAVPAEERRGRGRQAVERDVEAELQRLAL